MDKSDRGTKLFATAITFKIRHSYDLRKILVKNNFSIRIRNRITNESSSLIKENYDLDHEVVLHLDPTFYYYEAIYSSFETPLASDILQQIKSHPSIINYNDRVADYGTD